MSVTYRFLSAIALVVLAFTIVAKAEDTESCSNASLHGNFGLRATGRTLAGGDIIVLGRFTYDGKGNLTATLFNRLPNAANETFTITGTYSVKSDLDRNPKPNFADGLATDAVAVTRKEKLYWILLPSLSADQGAVSVGATKMTLGEPSS